MLVLGRRPGESIVIDGVITLTVLEVTRSGQVRLGIDAPRHHQVLRKELVLEIQAENRTAVALDQSAIGDLLGRLLPGEARTTEPQGVTSDSTT